MFKRKGIQTNWLMHQLILSQFMGLISITVRLNKLSTLNVEMVLMYVKFYQTNYMGVLTLIFNKIRKMSRVNIVTVAEI